MEMANQTLEVRARQASHSLINWAMSSILALVDKHTIDMVILVTQEFCLINTEAGMSRALESQPMTDLEIHLMSTLRLIHLILMAYLMIEGVDLHCEVEDRINLDQLVQKDGNQVLE